MIRSGALFLLGVATILVAGDSGGQSQTPAIVFTHVTVIDGTGAAPRPDQSVTIEAGRIRELGPTRRVRAPAGAQIVDATGKFLIPGLMDMHVHAIWSFRTEQFPPLFIANGVTTVRDLFGDLEVAAQLRREMAAGTYLGPRFVTSGPIVDGPKPVWQGSIAVADAAQGRQAVHTVEKAGGDFVKVYSLLPRDAYFAIADEAKKEHIPFAGHVPESVTPAEAAEHGQRSMEHLGGIHLAVSRDEAALRAEMAKATQSASPALPRARVAVKAAASYDPAKAQALFATFVKHRTWQVPTLTVLRALAYRTDPAFIADPRVKYMDAQHRAFWRPTANPRLPLPSGQDLADIRGLFDAQVRLVGAMHRARVPILAGTDTPNPYVFPGFSLHDELALFVKAGMTPLEALQSATRNASEFLGTLREVGTIERGKRADLVLLDANPLRDLANLKRRAGVMVRGRWLTEKDLSEGLAEIAARASAS